MIHVDVMDGHFVPNLTIGPPVIKALKKNSSLPFDVHLMITPVHKYIESYAKAGADIITIHPEATSDLLSSINKIKELKKKVGVSLNPETKVEVIEKFLDQMRTRHQFFQTLLKFLNLNHYLSEDKIQKKPHIFLCQN